MNNTQENIQQTEKVKIPLTPKAVMYPMMWGFFAILMAVATVIFPFAAVVTVAFGSLSFALMKLYAPSVAYERLLPIIFTVASLLVTDSLTLTAFLLGVFLPGGYMMAWVIGARKKFSNAVSSQFLVYAIYTVVVFLIALGEISDFDLDNLIKPFAATVKDMFGQMYDVIVTLPYEGFTVTRDNFIYDFYKTTISLIPSFAAIFYLATGTLSYWMAKSVLRRKRNLDPESVKFFSNFDLFRVSPVGGGVYVIVSILALIVTTTKAAVIIATVDTVMNVVFCYGGASVIGFFMKMRGIGRGVRGFVYFMLIIVCLFVPGPSSILSLIGLFDCFWNLRRFIRPSAKYM